MPRKAKPVPFEFPTMSDEDSAIVAQAMAVLEKRACYGDVMSSPDVARKYFACMLAPEDREVFVVAFLNAQNQMITCERMFTGTLSQTAVYPREVVKAALRHNASAVLLAHNHPSGIIEPSRADKLLTQTLKLALELIDVRVLDHFVIGSQGRTMSFAERGLI